MRKKHHNKRNTHVRLGGSTRPVAYCKYHRRTLSSQQIKSKHCREKNCGSLRAYYTPEEHAAWKEKQRLKRDAGTPARKPENEKPDTENNGGDADEERN